MTRRRRRRRRGTPLLLLALGTALLIGVVQWQRTDGPEPVTVVARPVGPLRVTWAGDTMLGDGAVEAIAANGIDWPLAEVRRLLRGDVVIVNAEAPITRRNVPFLPSKAYSYNSPPAAAGALRRAGIDVLGLANNHAMDQGPPGLADTIRHSRGAGMAAFGAGADESAAERPLVIESPVITVGVVALGEGYGSTVTAAPDQAGTIPLANTSIRRGHRLAVDAGADFVVAYVHWGENYQGIDARQRLEAGRLVRAGYDLVIGHGPHVTQPARIIDGVPVLYSIGNFVFGAPGRFTDLRPGYGFVAETTFDGDGLARLTLTCIITDNDEVGYQPRRCRIDEAAAAFAPLGVAADVRGPTAVIDLSGR